MARPTPKTVKQVCSLCGLDWKGHGKNPTAETCVKLLLDEVKSLNAQLAVRPAISYPTYIPYPSYPSTRPYWPTWYTTIGSTTVSGNVAGQSWTGQNTANPVPITIKANA